LTDEEKDETKLLVGVSALNFLRCFDTVGFGWQEWHSKTSTLCLLSPKFSIG